MNRKISLGVIAVQELGVKKITFSVVYRLLSKTGLYRLRSAIFHNKSVPIKIIPSLFPEIPELLHLDEHGKTKIIKEADEILHGKITLFGEVEVKLDYHHPLSLQHWSEYHLENINGKDIKFFWEPARFTWVLPLIKAYQVTGNEIYAHFFLDKLIEFVEHNPKDQGIQWISAQEVGIRLIMLIIAANGFAESSIDSPLQQLLSAVLPAHADRIPPTLIYARAQNNNHLFSEAVALFTAGVFLPQHPRAKKWKRLGKKRINQAVLDQISPSGAYVQNSTNYHRLMLQLCIWMNFLGRISGDQLSSEVKERIKASIFWLGALTDPSSGKVPNLGPNDGALLFSNDSCDFQDYRPTIQAASRDFLGSSMYKPGPWDELSDWFSIPQSNSIIEPIKNFSDPILIHSQKSRVYLRAAKFHDRPGHADQLNVDLWWRDENLIIDPGTYLYNAEPPWQNALGGTDVHNTITIDGLDQMTRAGKFLWLDWAQAKMDSRIQNDMIQKYTASHNGYQKRGVIHQRSVSTETDTEIWLVEDELILDKQRTSPIDVRLQWLLPDWDWSHEGNSFSFQSPYGLWAIRISSDLEDADFALVRAGELLVGKGEARPYQGWRSISYAKISPALSLVYRGITQKPSKIITKIDLSRLK
ncbi:MAG: alginate lyase family protein [Anaerolineales bacterium]|nr:alginate lyase family protein [Anaerolineales bacterium]